MKCPSTEPDNYNKLLIKTQDAIVMPCNTINLVYIKINNIWVNRSVLKLSFISNV